MVSEAKELSKTNWLTILGMCTAMIVFVFTTFENKADAEREYKNETESVQDLHHDFEDLRKELHDQRKELNAKLDTLIESRGYHDRH